MTSPTPSASKAIITGHTRGIGAALSEVLLERGFVVLGVARTRHESLDSRHAGAVEQAEVDLADTRSLEQWLAQGQLRHFVHGASRVVLINNAGTVAPIGPCGVQPPLDVARSVALNVAAPLMLSSAFSEATREAADRRIAHVSSGAARNAYAGWNVYCATKAALDHHARAAALDAERGMRIAAVAPGVIDTDMQAALRAVDESRFPSRGKFVDLKAEGKLTSPEDTARKFVDYLLSNGFGKEPTVDLRSLPPQ